ncbi:MAG: O-antigen ligase family protein [Chroococcidiopsidaceae cyanobacterium CP_BM_ER_R8_30]|nr:O-antigen ligase family protein [Chroococcidiopsidaceae cyanobacterium CP_BM_ER_R8_30]
MPFTSYLLPFGFLQRHPNKRLQSAWNHAQLGLLALPFSTLIGILLLCLACVQTWRQQYRLIIRRPLNWAIAGFSVWLVITSCFAYSHSVAFIGLFNFLPYFLVFAGYSALVQTPAQLRRWAWILVITSVPVVIIGLGQLFWGWGCHFQFLSIVLDWEIAPNGNPPGRMASVLTYANTLAGYLVIVLSLSLGLLIENCQTLTSLNDQRHLPTTARFRLGFLSAAVSGNLVALILTDSRNAWAIAMFIGLAFALYQGWRWLVAGVMVVVGSVLCSAFGPLPVRQWLRTVIPAFFWARLTDQLYPNRPLATLRETQWQFAWNLAQQHPWLGWGLRNFTPLYKAQMHVWLGHPHNFLLMLTAEIGIPAGIFFCVWVGWIVFQGFQTLGNWKGMTPSASGQQQVLQDRLIFFSYLVAFVACIFLNTVDVTVFDTRLNSPGWLLLAAICGVTYHQRAVKVSYK